MNKIITLEILKDLDDYLKSNLNNSIEIYNQQNNTKLRKINNISYKEIKNIFPEVFFQIKSTNFEYIEISRNENMQISNECFLFYADKDNSIDFQDNIERMIFIIYDLIMKFKSNNIAYFLIKNIDRDEMQSKDMQIIKTFVIYFDIITLI